MRAIIVGTGLAGLAAGYRLKKAGWEVIAFEAAPTIGGRTTTKRLDGYIIEGGATQISTGYKQYLALAKELGLERELVRSSDIVIVQRDGRQYEINIARPITAALSPSLSFGSKLRLLRGFADFLALKPPVDVLDVSKSHAADIESAEAYCQRRLNSQIFDVFVDPFIRAYTLNRGANVSALEWFSAIRNLGGQKFLSMGGGIARLPAALAAHLDVRLSSPVLAVRPKGGGVEVDYRSGSGVETADADACVIASPLPVTAEIAPSLADAIGPLASQLSYNRAVMVSIGFTRRPRTQAIGVLVPTTEHPQIGLVWLEHNKIADAAPPGHAQITCYFEEGGMDSVQPNANEEFVRIAHDYLLRLFPELEGSRDMVHVSRWTRAIPNPAPGIYRAIHEMKQQLDPANPIQIAGDYLTCTGQNSAVHWGQVAAGNVLRHHGRTNAEFRIVE